MHARLRSIRVLGVLGAVIALAVVGRSAEPERSVTPPLEGPSGGAPCMPAQSSGLLRIT